MMMMMMMNHAPYRVFTRRYRKVRAAAYIVHRFGHIRFANFLGT